MYNGGMDYDILPTEETTTVENRRYINPNLPVAETNQFIDAYRETQQANNQQIAGQTQALGTDVPSNLGGLTGAGSYFTSRYETPQTNTALQDLRTTAQATALNEALANEQAMWKKRYQEAYQAYQKRQNDKTNTPTTTTKEPEVDTNEKTGEKTEVDPYKPGEGEVVVGKDGNHYVYTNGSWSQLVSPRKIDEEVVGNTLAGKNPTDGTIVEVPNGNGRRLYYLGATGNWYEMSPSDEPEVE